MYIHDVTGVGVLERFHLVFYLNRFGFYKYMKMDEEDDDRPLFFPNPDGVL